MRSVGRVLISLPHREAEKRNHFSFMNKSFNTQYNLTKFSTLIISEYYIIDVTYLISRIYTNIRRLLYKKCDVGLLTMKLMITG